MFLFKRIESLRVFTEGSVDFMLTTDLAARGLDIERVKTVRQTLAHSVDDSSSVY